MTTTRPNVLFIMSDQHRYDYLGCAGADFIDTPNIDHLASNGMHFTQCTTNSPVCAPARIGLASGLQPWRIGALNNQSFLPRSTTTFYQRLRDYDYRVGCVGKLDLAKPDHYNGRYGDRPSAYRFGFTHPHEAEGKMHAGQHPEPIGPYTHFLHDRGLLTTFHEDYMRRRDIGWMRDFTDSALPTDAFEDAYIGQHAVDFIDWVPDDFPWFYYVSFVGPHDPFDPPTEYADRYRTRPMPEPIADDLRSKPRRIQNRFVDMSAEETTNARRQYCAAMELNDFYIGKMVEALERRGQLENTYIIYTSDHGEMLGDHGLYQKHVAYEASMRVPLVIAGPDIAKGQTSDALVELIDLNATVCDLAGLPDQENIDAQSLRPVLENQTSDHRTETLTVETGYAGLRTPQYKYIDTTNDMVELYDLDNDPYELNNIAEAQPEITQKFEKRLRERLTEDKWLR
ncbi:MAG: sulfatase-like hydrolase/transferase [Chloroflexota bacterium]